MGGNGERVREKESEREMPQHCFVAQQLNKTQFYRKTLKYDTFWDRRKSAKFCCTASWLDNIYQDYLRGWWQDSSWQGGQGQGGQGKDYLQDWWQDSSWLLGEDRRMDLQQRQLLLLRRAGWFTFLPIFCLFFAGWLIFCLFLAGWLYFCLFFCWVITFLSVFFCWVVTFLPLFFLLGG